MNIYTITLSPAYDIHADADNFAAGHECLATVTSRDAGGKGVNISRALWAYHTPNTAVVVLGKENAADFCRDIADMHTVLFEKEGRIRENLTLHSPGGETRISFRGFAIDDSILPEIGEKIAVDENTIVTFTGRVPEGMTVEASKTFLKDLQNRGAKIVLDSKSFGFNDILDVKPWLIKPNEEEIAEYLSAPVCDLADAAKKAKIFLDGGVENVMVTMGNEGAVLLTAGKTYVAESPKVTVASTVGAGDSAIAGFMTAANEDPAQRLKTAVAFGSAACTTQGTKPPAKEIIEELMEKISVKII